MKIIIEFDSCWQTGFLGDDLKKPILKKIEEDNKKLVKNYQSDEGYEKKFVATSGTRGETSTPISDSTVLGLLCRLIGDQRKLYQARQSNNYYFSDMEEKISLNILQENPVSELMYLTNKSDARCSQGAWLGVLPDDNPWFFSETSFLLWSVLFLDRDELLDFILENEISKEKSNYIDCRPTNLLSRINLIADVKTEEGKPWNNSENIKVERKRLMSNIDTIQNRKSEYINKSNANPPKTDKQKLGITKKLADFDEKIESLHSDLKKTGTDKEIQKTDAKLNDVVKKLEQIYPDCNFWSEGQLYPQRLYASALYEKAERLIRNGVSMPFVLEGNGKSKGEISIKGFSRNSKAHRGFNGARDWLNTMAGGRKKSVGTPCIVQKHSGELEIELKLDNTKDRGLINPKLSRAEEIAELIENAGVSSFYLGKKGLAYVSSIRI